MYTATQIAHIATYYRTQTNTYGHVATVIERRPCGDRTEAAWEPMTDLGVDTFGMVELILEEGFYAGEIRTFEVRCFHNPKAAVAELSILKASYIHKDKYTLRLKRYQLPQAQADRVEAANTWKAREAQRFADGTYTPLPWADEAWFKDRHAEMNHFAHVSVEDPGKIAFTRDNNYGAANVKTRMSAGRYLQEYFAYALSRLPRRETGGVNVHGEKVTVDALNHYARTFTKTYGGADTLAFATTAEDMVNVYQTGPQSCMAYDTDHYACAPYHPIEVYAAGDLHLAYLMDAEKRITARALVWPDKMLTGRIYGDEVSLQCMLSDLGYAMQDHHCLAGARLLKIPFGDGYVMPYVDGAGSYGPHKTDPKFFQIGGDRTGDLTIGLDHENACTCDNCGTSMSEDYAHSVRIARYDYATYCEDCLSDNTFCCDYTNDTWSMDVDHTVLANGNIVADRFLSGHYGECAITGEWYRNEELFQYGADGEVVSQDGIDADDLVADEDGTYWQADELPSTTDEDDTTAAEKAA